MILIFTCRGKLTRDICFIKRQGLFLKQKVTLKNFSFKGTFYRFFIDPLISAPRKKVASMIMPGESVIDIACGTGALSTTLARHAGNVTGIDLSEDMIETARRIAERRKLRNITFELLDATDLLCYPARHFDIAVTSMAMHQFDRTTAVKVLSEMRRIARKVIIVDYNCPMSPGPASMLAWSIEFLAKGDHYSNFRSYMKRGGITSLAAETGINFTTTEVMGSGVFVVAQS